MRKIYFIILALILVSCGVYEDGKEKKEAILHTGVSEFDMSADEDGDMIPNNLELEYGLNPLVPDRTEISSRLIEGKIENEDVSITLKTVSLVFPSPTK